MSYAFLKSDKVEETSNKKCPEYGLKEANISEVRDQVVRNVLREVGRENRSCKAF